jgi:hypothetical protein
VFTPLANISPPESPCLAHEYIMARLGPKHHRLRVKILLAGEFTIG